MKTSNLIKFNHENVIFFIHPEKYSEFTNFCTFFLGNKVYENLANYIIGSYFKTLSKYAKDNDKETAFIEGNKEFIKDGGVIPIEFMSKFVSKHLTKNTLKAIYEMDKNITFYVMDSVESYLLNDAFCKENLYNCVNSFPYQIIGTKINLNQFIKSELENHILECEPKFKNQLDKAVKHNDSNKFKKLKSIFEEVSEAELQEAIELCDKHNSKVSREFPQITLEKTGEKSNYYTLYSHSEKYDIDSKKNIIITKYLQNVSIDLLKAVNRLISYYPTTRINLSTDDYRIKSASKINSQNNPTLTFGKYNGKDILSVCKTDKNYCLWLMKQLEANKKLSAIQSKIYDIIYIINKENGWNKLNEGGQIGNTFEPLASAKELGIIPKIEGHDMVAVCDCGEKFSYQNSKNNILWKCPECYGMKRIETD